MALFLWMLMICGFVSAHEQFILKESSFTYDLCDVYQGFKVKNIELIPSVPVKGESLTVNVDGFLEKEVTDGSELKVFLKFMKIGLLRKTFDICKELKDADDAPMKCPVEKGDKSWSYTFDIPNSMPSGDYEVYANVTSSSDEILLCSKIYFTM